ncbi:MAG: GFA family protein [Bradyrhizobium sp.]|nr:GFA family protein [Bradyrhizobium sp.]
MPHKETAEWRCLFEAANLENDRWMKRAGPIDRGGRMSNITGGCHCGAIRYQVEGEPIVHALCHCTDCRRHAGAPMVGWTMYPEDAVKVTKGQPKVYESSEHGRRQFCADCGTGLFYTNANVLPGLIDIQSGTYDDPDAVPAVVHIQVAERLRWMEGAHQLPSFERYPPQP